MIKAIIIKTLKFSKLSSNVLVFWFARDGLIKEKWFVTQIEKLIRKNRNILYMIVTEECEEERRKIEERRGEFYDLFSERKLTIVDLM